MTCLRTAGALTQLRLLSIRPFNRIKKPTIIHSHQAFGNITPFHMSSGLQTVSDVIKDDHRELEEYYNHIVNGKDQDEMTRYQNQFVWELARHSIAEEIVVYPAMEKHISNGKELADRDRKEHQKVRTHHSVESRIQLLILK